MRDFHCRCCGAALGGYRDSTCPRCLREEKEGDNADES